MIGKKKVFQKRRGHLLGRRILLRVLRVLIRALEVNSFEGGGGDGYLCAAAQSYSHLSGQILLPVNLKHMPSRDIH